MRVVSNSSPLIFLGKLDRVELLEDCFASISIPEAVRSELGSQRLPAFVQTFVLSKAGQGFVDGAVGRLHAGELAAMRLAKEMSADLVLLDDLLARKKAIRLGLKVMGTLGVLLLANRQKRISADAVMSDIVMLRQHHNLYLSDELLEQVRAALGAAR